MSSKQEVVIIGGGSGASLAHNLSKAAQFDPAKYNLTLISPLPYHVHLLAAARMAVTAEGSLDTTEKALVPFNKLFAPGRAGRFLQGEVRNVKDGLLELVDGSTVQWNYLVVATGSKWTGPADFSGKDSQGVHDHIDSYREDVAAAQSIVVVGGGAVGIEIATEIKHYYPKKTVTIVHGDTNLVNASYPDKFRNRVSDKVKAFGVSLVLGDRLASIPAPPHVSGQTGPVTITTQKGKTITADLFISAIGASPNTALLASYKGGSTLTTSGSVRVSPTFNVNAGNETLPNVWAIGDIVDIKEQHMLAKAGEHVKIVTKNILAAVAGVGAPVEYKGFMEAIFITRGPEGGMGFLPMMGGVTLGNWLVAKAKSATLFTPTVRKGYGLAA